MRTMGDNISREAALAYPLSWEHYDMEHGDRKFICGVESYREYIEHLPSTGPKKDDENEIKFFYVESIDDYWIGGVRIGNFYYATWHGRFGFIWSHSKYLPWGEHIVDENTLWKEYTYPSEPIEIPFTEWIAGFVKKYFAEPKKGLDKDYSGG